MKGFGIASIPSMGQIRTTDVPRHTTKPKALVSSSSLYGSSGSENKQKVLTKPERFVILNWINFIVCLTLNGLIETVYNSERTLIGRRIINVHILSI